ncbi:hypothetical protein [Actinosynnema pretiosum]|uniref:Uncharacterized protein n=1 Tax=Actinosynnema pretiosum TaxID=42197 RepID=A0A290YZ13_9PSEU|nr:hypothetical protein [Actinosynnema pretiosum]ATE51997.1 hypothetical protein CNX65_00750 [Actinosynnema pretiosum]
MTDGNTVRLTQAAPAGFLGAQAPATGPTPPADTASTQVVRPGDVAAAHALGGPPGAPARAEEEDGTEAPGTAATRVLSALDVAALVAPATTTLIQGITRTGHPEGVIPDGATKHLGPAELAEAGRAATQSTTQTISLKDLAHALPASSATHRITAAEARAASTGQGPAATQVVPGAQPGGARTTPPGSTPPGGATAAGSATPIPPAPQSAQPQSAQPQAAQAAGAQGGQLVHGPVSPAATPAAPAAAPAPAAAQNAAHQTPDAPPVLPTTAAPSGMSAGTTAAAGATGPAAAPGATGTTADPTTATAAEPISGTIEDPTFATAAEPVVDPADLVAAVPLGATTEPAATTGAAPIPAAPLPAAPPQTTDPTTTAASAPTPAPTTPTTDPATADPVTAGATTAGAAAAAADPAEGDASFTGAAKADLEKAGAALDAVDKGQVKLAMDNQSVDELLKLITEARDMVSSVHVTALTSLDVELRFGDNWVGRSISKRLHDLAVGDESSAVNVIGDFLRILLEVEETIRRAARNIRNADDDARDNFNKSGWGHH